MRWILLLFAILFAVFLASQSLLDVFFQAPAGTDKFSIDLANLNNTLFGWMRGSFGKIMLLLALIVGAFSMVGFLPTASDGGLDGSRKPSSGGGGNPPGGKGAIAGFISSIRPPAGHMPAPVLPSRSGTSGTTHIGSGSRTVKCPFCKQESRVKSKDIAGGKEFNCPSCGKPSHSHEALHH